ncbi:SMI1/KNR4 family protein [Allohahella sp. A8]|uniref:SMI1/KNR4 family protein n=1 Tax=Allohahella sp. A8 TaxID=3141461 RepID=UPI003A80982F
MINQLVKVQRPALDLAELEYFENKIGVKFPAAYRSFLISCNGGTPSKPSVFFDGSALNINGATINYFYGFGGASENIDKSYSVLKYDLPELMVPIANTPGGNYFLISLKNDSSFGKVYYFDHEFEYDDDEEFDEENGVYPECLAKVANSFSDLAGKMVEL